MAINFNSFTEGTTSTIQSNDYVVGFDTAVPGGERKYTVSTLANAVSSVASLGTVKSVTGTAPIAVANGTTTPSISIAAATTSADGSMSSTDKTRLDDASAVNGLVKCNGAGDFSAAVAGTDYLTSASSGSVKAWATWIEPAAGFTSRVVGTSGFNVSSITKTTSGDDVRIVNFTNPIAGTYCILANGDIDTLSDPPAWSGAYCLQSRPIDSSSCQVLWYTNAGIPVPTRFYVAIIQ